MRYFLFILLVGLHLAVDWDLTAAKNKGSWLTCETDKRYAYKIHLPSNYEVKTEKKFETIFIFSPGGSANFRGLEQWADNNDVILIASRDSKNGLDPQSIYNQIFKALVTTAEKKYRVHPVLKYTMGKSGGAWCSVKCADQFNQKFAGVFLMAHSGNYARVPAHIAVAFYYGTKDTIHGFEHVEKAIKFFKKQGNPVYARKEAVGHIWAPKEDTIEILNWMLNTQRYTHKYLSSKMKKDLLLDLKADVEKLLELEDLGDKKEKVLALLEVPAVLKLKEGKDLVKKYGESLEGEISALADDKEAFLFTEKLEEAPYLRALPSSTRKALSKKVAKLKKTELKGEFYAKKMFLSVKKSEDKYGASKAKTLINSYGKIVKKYPETIYGQKSQERIAALKK